MKTITQKVSERIAHLKKINQNRSLQRIYLHNRDTLIDSEGNILEARVDLESSPELIDVPTNKDSINYPLNFEGMSVSYDEANIILGKDAQKPGWTSRTSISRWEMQAMMDTFRVRDRLRVSGYAFGVNSVFEDKIVIPVMYFRGVRQTGEKINCGKYDPKRDLEYARYTIKEKLLEERKK